MSAAVERDQQEWDQRYAADGDDTPMWSGRPNGALVDEVAGMPPGTALEVGCGEGADAIWLAGRGWSVTALDPSVVALRRAEAAAAAVGVEVDWVRAGLLEHEPGDGHDLVTAMYPAVRHDGIDQAIDRAVTALLGHVAPGGTLLLVHHDLTGDEHTHAHDDDQRHDHDGEHDHEPFDPADYLLPADVRARLDGGFAVEVDEVRPRSGPLPPEARHVDDIVLRLRRHP